MTTPSERRPSGRRNALLDKLMEQYSVIREGRPLAIGVHKILLEKQPDLDKAALRTAMRAHTQSTRYLKGIVEGAIRHDLEGNPDGSVTAEQQEQAVTTLKDRIRRSTERRKADEATRKAEEEMHKRQEKLLQLTEKFNVR